MGVELDLLSLLENSDTCPADPEVVARDVCLWGLDEQASVEAASSNGADDDSQTTQRKVKLPSMIGKVGGGRHGEQRDKDLLALHMRHCKMAIQQDRFRDGIADLLQDSTFRSGGKLIGIRAEQTCTGVVIKLTEKSSKGNRFRKAIPWGDFLAAAYGKLRRDTHLAYAMNISRGTAGFMRTMVASVYLGQQSAMLGHLIQLCTSRQPTMLIRQLKWDETTLSTSIDADGDCRRVASAWQVMICKQRILIGWADGSIAVFRLAMPPVVLLATGAHHMYYGLKYHAMYRTMQGLVDALSDLCFHRVQLYESDGAYANERLIAHLIQKNQASQRPMHLLHLKCQNHQSQLVNISILTSTGFNILNRMYGFAVFIRNLGNWLRLKQALRSWVSEHLDFIQDLSDSECPKSTNPVMLDLRSNRQVEAESSQTSQVFERRVDAFLEMWNGSVDRLCPVHHCTATFFAMHQRHCKSREAAAKRCADTLIDLLVSSMPSVPAPNKWTSLYPCLDP